MKHFYVSSILDARRWLLAGPYATHDAALAQVDAVRRKANEGSDMRAAFMAYGTSGSDEIFKTPLGAGWLPVNVTETPN